MDENPNAKSIFRLYTQKSCEFECAFQRARKVSGCVPYDMPQLDIGNETICTRQHVRYFTDNMTEALNDGNDCNCLPDCEEVTFGYSTNSVLLDPDQECEKEDVVKAAWDAVRTVSDHNAWKEENVFQFQDRMNLADVGFDARTRCHRKVKEDFAVLRIVVGSAQATQFVRRIQFNLVSVLTLIGILK